MVNLGFQQDEAERCQQDQQLRSFTNDCERSIAHTLKMLTFNRTEQAGIALHVSYFAKWSVLLIDRGESPDTQQNSA